MDQEVKALLASIETKRSAFEAALDDRLKNSTIKAEHVGDHAARQDGCLSNRLRQRADRKYQPHPCERQAAIQNVDAMRSSAGAQRGVGKKQKGIAEADTLIKGSVVMVEATLNPPNSAAATAWAPTSC